jgi:hypothetical protein
MLESRKISKMLRVLFEYERLQGAYMDSKYLLIPFAVMDIERLLMLTPKDSFVAKGRKKWLEESGVWEKIICLIQPAIARLLCERIEQSKGRGFDGTKSGSVIFFLHFYLKSLPSQPILHFAHLFSPFLSRPGFRKLFYFFK